MRIQLKLTISFVIIAVFSTLLCGVVTFHLAQGELEEMSRAQAFKNFQEDYAAYVSAYGSLEAAMTAEGFDVYISRTNRMKPQGRSLNSPYHHLVVDPQGVVLMPVPGFKVGETVQDDLMKDAVPVKVGSSVVALVAEVGSGAISAADFNRFSAIRRSLYIGATVAVVLSVLFSLILSRFLIAPLRTLVEAVRVMRTSTQEVYQVEVVSDDELGQLTESLNEMNVALVDARAELEQLAIRDPLTDLYNRLHFDEQMRQFFESSIRYGQPLAVMISDVDGLRMINETYGHDMGDLVLEKVAEIITTTTRKSDVVARYSGQEIVVMFANTSVANATVSCEKIRQAVESYEWSEFHPDLAVTVSIGLCDNTGLPSASAMISRADQLVSDAKNQGRNRVVNC